MFLLCKHHMHSSALTQEPILILPASRLGKLAQSPTAVLGRNKFSDRQVAEFRKTARVIAEPPWGLRQAAEYLTRLCDDNVAERPHDPPSLIFFNTQDQDIADLETQRNQANPPEELLNFAPGTPRRVVANLHARPRVAEPARGRGGGRRGRGRGKGVELEVGPEANREPDVADGEEVGVPAAPPDGEVPEALANGDANVPPPAPLAAVPPPAPLARRSPQVPKAKAKRGLKRPAAAGPSAAAAPAAGPGPGADAEAGPAARPVADAEAAPAARPGADADARAPAADPGADGDRRVRYRQSTINKQTTLGCSKCCNSPIGCRRCREIHELWKAQQGQT